ncbi:hypothetical protein K1719_003576 [Acacia pycnantha]|nr:hypothetical protein K1719_003576 [Acacia pycnantha]
MTYDESSTKLDADNNIDVNSEKDNDDESGRLNEENKDIKKLIKEMMRSCLSPLNNMIRIDYGGTIRKWGEEKVEFFDIGKDPPNLFHHIAIFCGLIKSFASNSLDDFAEQLANNVDP